MRSHVHILFLAFATVFVSGCGKEIEVNGEVFASVVKPAKSRSIEPGPGIVVYLLTERENEALLQRLRERQRVLKIQNANASIAYTSNKWVILTGITNRVIEIETMRKDRSKAGKPNTLIESHRKQFPSDQSSDEEILRRYAARGIEALESYPDALLDYLEAQDHKLMTLKGRMDYEIDRSKVELLMPPYEEPVFDFSTPEIISALSSVRNVTSDIEGKFKVKLDYGKTYYIAAGSKFRANWHFKFKPEGQKLILSDGNEMLPEDSIQY